MSGLVYPANLPGLTFGSTRTPVFNTGLQQAVSGKESAIAYQQYPIMEFELQYELLRDFNTPSDLKALVGLFMACRGKFDSFLYSDPVFNTVANMQFGVTDGTTLSFQTTATFQNVGGPGGAEIIQNFNGTPFYSINRYGSLIEYPCTVTRTQYCLASQTMSSSSGPWVFTNYSSLVGGPLAPDGTATTVALIDTTNSNVTHSIAQFFGIQPSGVYTFSIFVSRLLGSTECRYIFITADDTSSGGTVSACFDLLTGAINVGSSGTGMVGPVAAMTATGPTTLDWWRISLAFTKTSSGTGVSCFVNPSQSTSSPNYAGTNGITGAYVWGAQFENAAENPPLSINPTNLAFPTMYIPTTTVAVTQQDIAGFSATGIVTINSANFGAIPGTKLLWTGSFFYRCRFDDDSMTSTQFMNKFWENKKVRLRQRKL